MIQVKKYLLDKYWFSKFLFNKLLTSTTSGPGIAINSMAINETFCVTGSDDGYLRLWPLDFAHVYLEAEHEGPVTAVDFSSDGLKILAGTALVRENKKDECNIQ